ncbi:MAG TPA: DUF1343 domain-containing protein [Prolixibacteraceae bacterium]|nr:DUF1343 domain-containing protein [Prolixibacteraceae bacterium]
MRTFKNKLFQLTMVILVLCLSLTGYASQNQILTGADQTELYLSKLKGKSLALVVNQTSRIGDQHLVDFLLSKKLTIKRIFAPEHGFRGEAGAGELIDNSKDGATGIPIISVYGKNRKASKEQLAGIDIVIFDIQDVGCRFYTYISTLHYMMEACAESNITLLILDRPNPNGDYIDGPVLQPAFKSFVGMDPIPVVHGCTIGEMAQMINGEKWLANGVKVKLEIIKVANYAHSMKYEPPVRPSPNLPNYLAIRIYPSLCFFEATNVSVGRGTQFPFQVLGYPDPSFGTFSFTPQSLKGMELNPLQKDKKCYGEDFRELREVPKFTLSFFSDWLHKFKNKDEFLTSSKGFNQLMGNDTVLKLILEGKGEAEIRKSWETELANYRAVRQKYLLYPDFNSAK